VAHKAFTEPLVCIRQAKPEKPLQRLTEPYKAKCEELHKKIEIAFISCITRNPAHALGKTHTVQII
jgi:hypothetical protein